MSSTNDIQPFKGGSWKECGVFLQRVRAAAWKEGKLRDQVWMADFVSLHLSDRALVWYFRLSPEVRRDWPQLEAALVDKWMPPGCDDLAEPLGVPTAADSPYEQLEHPERVILKVVEVGKQEARYVTRAGDNRDFGLSSDAGQALRFRFDPQLDPKLFECVDRQPYSLFGVHWEQKTPSFSRGSTSYAELTAVNCATLKSPVTRGGPFQIATFKIAKSGEVTPLWRDGTTETSLKAFTNSSNDVLLVPDADAFQKSYGCIPATLFIQKVD
ncbi:hypothetical protein FS837_006061 [Tulasnella sp. UAMH 9824]|nr:hypothetical protein FS837_006061 [Tulasnella sp. UAMH 9824]